MKNKFNQRIISGIFFFCCIFCTIYTANAQPKIIYTTLLSNLSQPVCATNAGDGSNRLFIVEQKGKIKIYKDGSLSSKLFLDIGSILSTVDEQGLLSLAFSPDYKNNRTFFVYYTDVNDAVTIARYKTSETNPDSAIANSGVILLSLPKQGGSIGRNGGDLHFGQDGYLYIGTGDGGTGTTTFNNPQNGKSLFGKILRLNVDGIDVAPYYTIPADNPYVTDADILDEIWAIGLRQAWRWTFDRQTGDMWIGDVGQSKWEEIDFRTPAQSKGANYGWGCYEGDSVKNLNNCGPVSDYVFPILAYDHGFTTGGNAVIGGYVYRGTKYPSLQGYYVCTDYASHNTWKIKPNGTAWDVYLQKVQTDAVVSFGEDEAGELFATTITGKLYSVTTDEVLPIQLVYFNAQQSTSAGIVTLKWQTAFEQNTESFQVQSSSDGRVFSNAGAVAAKNLTTGFSYTFNVSQLLSGKIFYRLAIKNTDGSINYSDVIDITNNRAPGAAIYPTVVENSTINLLLNDKFNAARLFDLSGREVMYKNLTGITGRVTLNIPKLASGTYLVLLTGDKPVQQKIVIK